MAPTTAVLLFCHNRPLYLARTLRSLQRVRKNAPEQVALIISQDGNHAGVKLVIQMFRHAISFAFQSKFSQPDQTESRQVYRRIAAHFGWGLSQVFDELGFERVIIVEDDMEFAPDFFPYFHALAPLLDSDPSLLCNSAWNDNGKRGLVWDSKSVYRTECFPGLGWMLTQDRWQALKPWADIYWDDWLRHPDQSRNRTSLYPEICRVSTFGRRGTGHGQFFEQHLASIQLCQDTVKWEQEDFKELSTKEAYDQWLQEQMRKARQALHWSLIGPGDTNQEVRLPWYEIGEQQAAMDYFGLMSDNKWGLARASYKGVLIFRQQGQRVFLAPKATIEGLGFLPIEGVSPYEPSNPP